MRATLKNKIERYIESAASEESGFEGNIIEHFRSANLHASAGFDAIAMKKYMAILKSLQTKIFIFFKNSYEVLLVKPQEGLKIMEFALCCSKIHAHIDKYPKIAQQVKVHNFELKAENDSATLMKIESQMQECRKLLAQEIPEHLFQAHVYEIKTEHDQMKYFWSSGIKVFDYLLQIERKNSIYFDWLGYCNLQLAPYSQNKIACYTEALRAYDHCLNITPNYFSVMFYKGRLLMDWGLLITDLSLVMQSNQLFQNLLDVKELDPELKEKSNECYLESYQVLTKLAGGREKANSLKRPKSTSYNLVESIKQYYGPMVNKMYFKPSDPALQIDFLGQNKIAEFADFIESLDP